MPVAATASTASTNTTVERLLPRTIGPFRSCGERSIRPVTFSRYRARRPEPGRWCARGDDQGAGRGLRLRGAPAGDDPRDGPRRGAYRPGPARQPGHRRRRAGRGAGDGRVRDRGVPRGRSRARRCRSRVRYWCPAAGTATSSSTGACTRRSTWPRRCWSAVGRRGQAPVSPAGLDALPRGLPVGIPEAPDALPAPERLSAAPWTVCAVPSGRGDTPAGGHGPRRRPRAGHRSRRRRAGRARRRPRQHPVAAQPGPALPARRRRRAAGRPAAGDSADPAGGDPRPAAGGTADRRARDRRTGYSRGRRAPDLGGHRRRARAGRRHRAREPRRAARRCGARLRAPRGPAQCREGSN